MERQLQEPIKFILFTGFSGLGVSVLAFGTQVREFLRAKKSSARLPSEGK